MRGHATRHFRGAHVAQEIYAPEPIIIYRSKVTIVPNMKGVIECIRALQDFEPRPRLVEPALDAPLYSRKFVKLPL